MNQLNRFTKPVH